MPKSKKRVSSGEDAPAEETRGRRDEGSSLDYEKVRLKRIEENKNRMEALGLRRMASSLITSVRESPRMGNGRKGKKKIVDEDEDEEYDPEQEDDGKSSSAGEDGDDEEFSPSRKKKRKKKVKSNTSTHQKRGLVDKPVNGSDFVEDDDEDLMKAIALSLQDSAGVLDVKDSQDIATAKIPDGNKTTKNRTKESLDDSVKKKRRRPVTTSRVQMSEDEVLVHFFQFDETGIGNFTVRDLRRLVGAHDFTWSEKEMSDMITCFDSDGDGRINLDDFRKIVSRCNMLKGNDD
ncbi:uncharacterized protein LOC127252419 [Andrographis paniculata]|uniref:uncharacterized protein LOC127252419 n=1 Tax=Andrographis paniculata TaxID=175694 RepID=UPI0021E8AC1C|nr:uncharacterized protein LOC127252419 [Andrographis paniculata]